MPTKSIKWQHIISSFVAILALRCASALDRTVLQAPNVLGSCESKDQPNPLAALYPNNATGVLNGSIVAIPIPLEQARRMIPAKYTILERAYRQLLPDFPKGMYPVIIQTVHDHDVQAFGFHIQDFTRAGIEFPFLDLLGDGSTSFKWVPSLLITATNTMALNGSLNYGTNTSPALFDPPCNAYRSMPNAQEPGTTWFSATSAIPGEASVTARLSTTSHAPFPMSFWKNVTNQVMFADGKTCDQQVRYFNTSLSTAPNTIETVKGTIHAKISPLNGEQEWDNAFGIRLASAFVENNYLPCEQFRGYSGVTD